MKDDIELQIINQQSEMQINRKLSFADLTKPKALKVDENELEKCACDIVYES